MRNSVLAAFVSVLFLAAAGTASAYTESSTDLWNYQNISNLSYSVDAAPTGSPEWGVDAIPNTWQYYNMFGTTNPNNEGSPSSVTLLSDMYGVAGTVHTLTWTLKDVVTVGSFGLIAAHDGGGRNVSYRGISAFKLYSSTDGTNWGSPVYAYSVTGSYYNPPLSNADYNILDLNVDIGSISSKYWKAEFYESLNPAQYAQGGRIIELDGFAPTAVPEPVSTALFILGGATLAARRLRGKR